MKFIYQVARNGFERGVRLREKPHLTSPPSVLRSSAGGVSMLGGELRSASDGPLISDWRTSGARAPTPVRQFTTGNPRLKSALPQRSVIHTWLQPGGLAPLRFGKPFKRFPLKNSIRDTWLKPGVTEKIRLQPHSNTFEAKPLRTALPQTQNYR